MKKLSLLLLSALLIFVSCKKDDKADDQQNETLTPALKQYGLAINYTATWCGPCGDWGAPLIHEFYDLDDVIAITVHASGDPMFNSHLYGTFSSVRPTGGGIPAFWVGDSKTTSMGSMTSLLEQTPIAGIAISSTKGESSIRVKTKTQFFEAGTGHYYLSVLILEDGIDGSSSAGEYTQNGTSNPGTYEHDFVLRASSVAGNAYGEEIISEPANGAVIEKEYEIALDENWANDVYAIAILWEYGSGGTPSYKFINAIK